MRTTQLGSSNSSSSASPALGRSRRGLTVRACAPPTYAPPTSEQLVLDVGGQQVILETGEIGRQANGAVMVTMGETVLYATACCSDKPQGDGSFVPLSVHYQERFSAAGKTSGSYLKREGRPRDDDVLVARLVDRPLRPMLEKGWCNETQVLEWVLSYDGVNQPEPLAITAAGAALLISDIPLTKAVAGVRVGYLPSAGFIINPSAAQMAQSKLDLLMAGTAEAVLMIEGFCEWLTEDEMLEAVAAGQAAISSMCRQLAAWAAKVGKPKRSERVLPPQGLKEALTELAAAGLEKAYRAGGRKEERAGAVSAIQAEAYATLKGERYAGRWPNLDDITLALAWKSVESGVMRQLVLREGMRADGRSVTDIRPITSRAGVLPRTHGSSLFTRGETQALCVATLGSDSDAQRIDGIRDAIDTSTDENSSSSSSSSSNGAAAGVFERFYLQYFFPPSSVGECGRVGPAGRRELGHGELAQRALAPAVPPQQLFPYVVRVESTITESNGSSSMASVCGGCLAMLDAGVPLTDPVAGIAMGLILEPDGSYVVLSDIQGSEDALGDMDFKVAGSARGVSAFQMDIKVEGITLDIMRQALAQAAAGRGHILQEMQACSPPPAQALSRWAPKVAMLSVPPEKLGMLIGPGGKTIKAIIAASGAADIVINNSGSIQIVSPTEAALNKARELITLQLDELPVGTILRQRRVDSVTLFGVFVELAPGKSGLVHLSELAEEGTLTEVPPEWKVGSLMDVMFIGTTADGKTRLSRKGVLLTDAAAAAAEIGTAVGTAAEKAGLAAAAAATSSSSSSGGGSRWYSGPGADGDGHQPRTPRREEEAAGSFSGGRGGGRGRGGSRGQELELLAYSSPVRGRGDEAHGGPQPAAHPRVGRP
ncbi:putative polyribonucleotide nucleotidyltransferase [Scenedesmus sp. NREL 46B-D3]|nr:putative polyribonucleotide nucleotidyltransferase [Scenedesmus sp. NREL 46B-D3]